MYLLLFEIKVKHKQQNSVHFILPYLPKQLKIYIYVKLYVFCIKLPLIIIFLNPKLNLHHYVDAK